MLQDSGPCKGLILGLLLNSSASHLALLKPKHALKLAAAAATLDPTSSKAYLRAGLALDALQLHGPANHFTRHAAHKGASNAGSSGNISEQLSEMMERLSTVAAAASATAAQAASAIRSALYADTKTLAPSTTGASQSMANGGSSVVSQSDNDQDVIAKSALVSKDQGNALFMDNIFEEALRCYESALCMLQQDCKRAAILLNNRSLCQARLGLLPSAVEDATAAVVMDPGQFKGYLRLGSALLQMDELAFALVCVNAGLTSCPGNTDLTELKQRIGTTSAAAARASRPATAASRSSQPLSEAASGASTSAEQNFACRVMTTAAQMASNNNNLAASRHAPGFSLADAPRATGWCDIRVKPFHTEFQQAGLWPAQCDELRAKEVLWSCYEHARALPMQDMVVKNEFSKHDPEQLDQVCGEVKTNSCLQNIQMKTTGQHPNNKMRIISDRMCKHTQSKRTRLKHAQTPFGIQGLMQG